MKYRSDFLRTTAQALSALALAVVAGCGGGGGGGVEATPTTPPTTPPVTPPTQAIATYGNTVLPGRLLVNAPDGTNARLMDLTTGRQQALPGSSDAAEDRWQANANGTLLVRWADRSGASAYPLAVFGATDLAPKVSPASISGVLGAADLRLSPDGKWLMAQYGDNFQVQRRLTIFDASTLEIQKRGSRLDDATVIGEPQAWLPDGRYVYLVANELWVSSPTSADSLLLARLPLPENSVFEGGGYVAGHSSLAVSPDGTRIAFTWELKRKNDFDTHVFVANIDGTGLRQLTAVADADSALRYSFDSPTWSPDGKWVAFVLYMNGAVVAPVWPDEPFGGARVVGTTGCDANPVYVLPATASAPTAIAWPSINRDIALKVKASSGDSGQWVSTCSNVRWIP